MPSCMLRPKEVPEEVLATFTCIDLIAPFSYTKVPPVQLLSAYVLSVLCHRGIFRCCFLLGAGAVRGKKALNVRESARGCSLTA